jgi:hypothetical protein
MEAAVDQIKVKHSATDSVRETLAKRWENGNIRALKLTNADVLLEFTCDEIGINLFIANPQPPISILSRRKGNTKVHVDGFACPLKGCYSMHDDLMITHFRFSPTRNGVLQMMKLVDVCVERTESVA